MARYKVLLIDDEPIILQGLHILIDWDALNLEIVGSASDGIQGLELIRELKPDIVISDIRMPNCTGVDMIRQAHNLYPCQFIVLSGYSDFAYAKQCISFGVQEYLLKPVTDSELTQALEKVIKLLDNRKESDDALIRLDDMNQQLQLLARDDILRDIFNSYFETDEDFYLSLSDYELSFPKGACFLAVAFQFSAAQNTGNIRETLSGQLNFFSASFLLFYYGNNTYMGIFSFCNESEADAFNEQIHTLHSDLCSCLKADISIGIGNTYPFAYQAFLSCKQAIYALSYKIIRGSSSVNPFDSNLKSAHFIQNIPDELWNTYRKSLLQPNFASISNAIHKIFYYMMVSSDMPLLGIQINALNLIMTCIQYLSETPSSTSYSYENMNFMQQISSIQSAGELEKYSENIIYSLLNDSRENELTKPGELVSKVENYINSNYLEDLSLVTVAQIFYISPIYLSQTFKKQTGQLYLDYVTQVKINAAKKMLLTTDLMVYEIAERLHYKDSKYFSRLFEKKTGKKPSEFRKTPTEN